jgi:hypothetical protein
MRKLQTVVLLAILFSATSRAVYAQSPAVAPAQPVSEDEVRQLALQVQAAERRLQDSEKELADLKTRLAVLESAIASSAATSTTAAQVAPTASDNAETLSMQSSQIGTLDQVKVESSSKFPVKLSGMVLLTASVNSTGVDSPVDPTTSLGGPGSTSLSLRQTVLGLDAEGPHLAGARSSADLRIDFYGGTATNTYGSAGGLVRLRTAHAALDWQHAQLFFAFDRTLLNPNTPTSLVQVAQPGLSWSGNLWNWMPQLGGSFRMGERHTLIVQGAWVSPPDAPSPTPT